ncbi:MAG: hypothetical protein PF448_02800 [Bacteroidales bacterium]|jgi:hypothetical protein|nr:hypothetical protein [Bacteroidales bacterium]
MMRFFAVLLFFAGFIFASCEREQAIPSEFQVQQISFPEQTEIRDIMALNDSVLFLCGGQKNIHGFIYQSLDAGKTWTNMLTVNFSAINAVYVDEVSGYWAAGDSLRIWHRPELNGDWELYEISNFPWDNYLNPYAAIYAWNREVIFAVGGEFYQKGITSKTETGDYSWKQTSWDNQWFDLHVWDINNVLISGYGQILYSDDRGKTFYDTELYGDAFVDLEENPYNEIFVLGEHGGVFRYNNQSWVSKSRLSGHLNDMAFSADYAVLIGQRGLMFFGDAHATDFTKTEGFTDANLSLINTIKDDFLIGTENGKLYRLKHE